MFWIAARITIQSCNVTSKRERRRKGRKYYETLQFVRRWVIILTNSLISFICITKKTLSFLRAHLRHLQSTCNASHFWWLSFTECSSCVWKEKNSQMGATCVSSGNTSSSHSDLRSHADFVCHETEQAKRKKTAPGRNKDFSREILTFSC